jgi:hypothetical protein
VRAYLLQHSLDLQLQVVAERAALEQIESIIRVVAESHQAAAAAGGGGVAGQGGGQAGKGRHRGRGSSNDIRGGGAH